MNNIKDLGLRYWLGTVILIAFVLGGSEFAVFLLVGLAAFQVLHYVLMERNLLSFSVQVRLAYFIFVLIGSWKPLRFVYWIPFFGISARLFFGYCLIARLISMAPWNRKEALGWPLVKRTIFSKPVDGNILDHLPPENPPKNSEVPPSP